MLKIEHLSKQYKNADKLSVNDLSLEINKGSIFGFLGRNGAGKSTTIKCITGILPFEQGKITVNGIDILKDPKKAKLSIGYVPDNHAVYEKMSAREYIYFMGVLYGMKKKDIMARADYLLDKFDLYNVADNQIVSFSHGMKQKVSVIGAIIHSPKLWILDEPLLGLDPKAAIDIQNFMIHYAHDLGNTIFFSSHNIPLVQKICDEVGIIKDGVLQDRFNLNEFNNTSDISLEDYFLKFVTD